jgi:isopentenyl diphosphate isomerase/L-lactate dehydrogenase-like FMN-dependent dehydrogenase
MKNRRAVKGWADPAAHDRRVASRIRSVDDARRLASRRVPCPVESYVEGGAGEESTLWANRAAVRSVQLRPRLGVTAGSGPDLRTSVLGHGISMPVLLSPVGFSRMMHPSGDVAAAAAAGGAGTIFTLSSMSGHSLEEVMARAAGPAWFQLYFLGGRLGARHLVADASRLGYSAVVVTMDTQIPGDRRRESRYGLSPPLQLDRKTVIKMAPFVAVRPRWLIEQARGGFRLELVNARRYAAQGDDPTADALLQWIAEPPTWEDLVWIRETFSGDVVVKGILSPDDAKRAIDCGASALIVSNHGGRQLDGVSSSFEALPAIVAAADGQVEVLVDGGIRNGVDVVKALAMGARAAMIGRAWAYGLCAAGQPGIERVLALVREDVDRTMRLLGVNSVAEIDGSLVRVPGSFLPEPVERGGDDQ